MAQNSRMIRLESKLLSFNEQTDNANFASMGFLVLVSDKKEKFSNYKILEKFFSVIQIEKKNKYQKRVGL